MSGLGTVQSSAGGDIPTDSVDLSGVDRGVEVDRYLAPCIDSRPLPGDVAACVETTDETGDMASVGYSVPSIVGPGEGRFFSRNSDGETAAQAWFKADGTIEMIAGVDGETPVTLTHSPDGSSSVSNALGGYQLLANGTVIINGVSIAPGGIITGVASMAASGLVTSGAVSLSTHVHSSTVPPAPPVPTTPPI